MKVTRSVAEREGASVTDPAITLLREQLKDDENRQLIAGLLALSSGAHLSGVAAAGPKLGG